MKVQVGDKMVWNNNPEVWWIIDEIIDNDIKATIYYKGGCDSYVFSIDANWEDFTKEPRKSYNFKNLYEKLCG